jgi:hypothetical protein
MEATDAAVGLLRRNDRDTWLTALVDTARELAAPTGLDAVLRIFARRARLLLSADMAYISLREPSGEDMVVRVSDGHVSALNVGLHVPHDSGLGGAVLSNPSPIWSADYLKDDRFPHSQSVDAVVQAEGLRAVLAVPLSHGDQLLGALYVGARSVRAFTHAEISLASLLSELAAAAMEKTRLLQEATTEADKWRDRADRASADARNLRSLIDLVLTGADTAALTALAHMMLDAPMRVLGPDGTVLAEAGTTPGTDADTEITAALAAHAGNEPVQAGENLWAVAVRGGQENRGTVLLWQPGPLGAGRQVLLGHVARALALTLARTAELPPDMLALDRLLDELVTSPALSAAEVTKRAARFDVGLDRPHVMLVARADRHDARTWAPMYGRRSGGTAAVRDGHGVLLLPGTDAAAAAEAASEALSTMLGAPVTVGGAGPISDLTEVPEGYRAAERCLKAMTSLGVTGRGTSVRELGFFGVLLSDRQDVAGFVDATIGRLVEYDRARLSDLVTTLEAYFAAGQSPTRAARNLHVHANTVTRRLERVAELLGPDWQEPASVLELQLALRLHRLRDLLAG